MIEIEGIHKSYSRIIALHDVTFSITSSEVLVLQGPSGSGKTTLLRLIAGLETPDKGQIIIDNQVASTPQKNVSPYMRGLGIVFQRSALWPHMTVAQNIRFAINRGTNQEKNLRFNQVLEDTDLYEFRDRYPSQLSVGEARRVAIARAIAGKPKRLLLDEPLINLDPTLKERLIDMIINLITKESTTVLYITHDGYEAEKVASRIIHIDSGKIIP